MWSGRSKCSLGNDTGSTGAAALAAKLGVKFNMSGYDDVDLRNLAGRKEKDCFAQSDTGKQIMTAMIDAVRRKEASGMVERFSHHSS